MSKAREKVFAASAATYDDLSVLGKVCRRKWKRSNQLHAFGIFGAELP
jgi:hypothetical protein